MKCTLLGVAGTAAVLLAAQASAQTLLYSFETLYSNPDNPMPDPMGTMPDAYRQNGGGTITQDTFGATDGTKSMKWELPLGATFNGALTNLGAPFPVINAASTTAIAVDLTVRPGEEFVGGFANLGITEFGENGAMIFGAAQTVAAAEQPMKLPAGTYQLIIPLIARNNPYTFELDVPFSTIVGPDPVNQMTATSFQFYINKGPTTGANPVPNAPLSAYLDSVRAVSEPISTWNAGGDGNWTEPGNWLGIPERVPNGPDAIAMFGLGGGADTVVTVDQPQTAGTLYFNTGSTYTIAGPGPITLDVSSGEVAIRTITGSHTIAAPITLNDDLAITVSHPATTLTLTGQLTATGRTITKAGAGTAELLNLNAAALAIDGGTVRLLPNGTAAGTSRVNSLTIAGGASPTARLDVSDNALVVDYNAPTPSPLSTIRAQVAAGYNGGGANAWTGQGITSASANAQQFAVGYAERSALPSVPPIFGAVDADAVLLRLTRYGDANLDGTTNLADFNSLASNFNGTNTVWTQGDFNYDGMTNLADFNLLAANFNQSVAAIPSSAVPEPAAAGLLALMPLLIRRRRRCGSARRHATGSAGS